MFSMQYITDKVNAVTIHSMLYTANVVGNVHHVQWVPARYLLQSTLFVASVLVPPAPICGNSVDTDPSKSLVGTLRAGITNLVSILMGIGIGIAVVGIIVGGLMRATSFGNERRIAMSNTAITCAVVGLVIVLVGATAGNAIPGWFGIKGYDACQIQQ